MIIRFSVIVLSLIGLAACGADETAPESANAPADSKTEIAYGEVSTERLMAADAEPGNWFTGGRDFGKGYFSPLTQINTDNVSRLGFAWDYEMFTTRGQEATPIVVDGVMYTSGTTGRVYALNAKTGEEIWFFDPQSDGQFTRYNCCGEINRGVAVWDGMVYVASLDGRMFGLDAQTGTPVWEEDTLIFKDRAANVTGAPQVAGSVVVIGNGGAELDARGYVSAYDLKTGEFAWRFFTVPGDPKDGYEHEELEEAAKTWDPNSLWEVGMGGTAWDAMAYDPDLNLLYVGTGNGALFSWYDRSPAGGDNLYLATILAINPDTGRLVWYHQQVPEERWDFTSVQPMILADMEFDGEIKQVLMQAPKNGFFYIYDRTNGKLLSANNYVPANWATHIDLETGRPVLSDAADYRDEPKFVYPSAMGGHNWHPMSYNPITGLVYIPAMESGMVIGDLERGHDFKPKLFNTGVTTMFAAQAFTDPSNYPPAFAKALTVARLSSQAPGRFVLKAFDPKTGETKWEQESGAIQERAGVMSTAGGLVFKGSDGGFFRAYDAETGEKLLEIETGSSTMAAPMTYTVDGEQYVAVQAGYGGGGWNFTAPGSALIKYGNSNRLMVFKLDGGAVPLPPEVPALGPIPQPPAQTATADVVAQGAALFGGTCAPCHANMPFSLSPDLRRMTTATHAEFNDIVLRGARRDRGMPQWDDVLDEDGANAVHAYLIDLTQKAYDAEQANVELEQAPAASTTGH